MRIAWAIPVVVCLARAWCQAPPGPAGFAAISGVVLNDATGNPVRRAEVTLYTLDDPPLEALTFSESNGVFGFHDIPPGKYRLQVQSAGFEFAAFGASNSRRPPATLKLSAGDVRTGLTFRLRPLGAISGTVLDADGEPVANVPMRLLESAWERLKPVYRSASWASSDDQGLYRFSEVVPGEYLVMATQQHAPASLVQPEASEADGPPQPKMYGAQFYPDAGRVSAATPLKLNPGQELDGIDFHLVARAVAGLRGKVVVPVDLPPNTMAQVEAFPEDFTDHGSPSLGTGAVPPDYNFDIPNLLPGPYIVSSSVQAGGVTYSAVERVEIPPSGLELTLHPERAINLSGRVELEGGGTPSTPFHIRLVPGGFPPGRRDIDASVKPDGAFTVANVTPGIWDIGVDPIPAGGFLKSMRLGDQDVLTGDMLIDAATQDELNVVVSARGAVVSGTVHVPSGVRRSPRAAVLLAPAGKFAHVLSYYKPASSDDTGHYEIKGVTPGLYQLYAFEELDPQAWEDPGFLKPFEAASQVFEVKEGARIERDTSLILTNTTGPAAPPPADRKPAVEKP